MKGQSKKKPVRVAQYNPAKKSTQVNEAQKSQQNKAQIINKGPARRPKAGLKKPLKKKVQQGPKEMGQYAPNSPEEKPKKPANNGPDRIPKTGPRKPSKSVQQRPQEGPKKTPETGPKKTK